MGTGICLTSKCETGLALLGLGCLKVGHINHKEVNTIIRIWR